MKELVKVKITFKKLFENYAVEIKDNEIIKPKIKMFIKNGTGQLEEITGFIRKNDHDIYSYKFSNGINFKCSDKHLLKTENGFKLLNNLNKSDKILVYNSSPTYLLSNKFYKKSYVYDLSLKNTHEYTTPNGLIHHNTTLARLLCSKYGVLFNPTDNLLTANGSAKKTRSINFVDSVIEPFLKIPPAKDMYKVVFIDEADNLTGDSFDSFRGIIEKYHKDYGRFIFTCNYVSKIPAPIQSRFTPYVFQQIPKEFVLEYCKKILNGENIKHDDKSINFIINNLYPDVRRIVSTLQKCSWNGTLEVNEELIVTNEKKILSSVVEIISVLSKGEDSKISGSLNYIIDTLANQDIEYRNIYTDLFFMKKIPAPAKIIINKYSNSHQNCLLPHMHFTSMIFEIIKVLQEYRKAANGK